MTLVIALLRRLQEAISERKRKVIYSKEQRTSSGQMHHNPLG
jgi:hypothetical protein